MDLLADTWADRVPHAEFAKLRREAPVFWHEEPRDTGFFAITKHDDIVTISRDHETFSTERGGTFIPTQREEDLMQMRLSILNMDPPRHDRLRKLISAGFTPRQIRRLIAAVEEHADEIVDAIAERGEVDFVADVASPLPLWMICEMLGIPQADWEQMRIWSDRMVGFDDPDLSVSPEVHMQAAIDMFTYCNELVQKRQSDPADDILSTLVHAEVDGDRLNELELNLFFVTLVIAGNETTRNLISHGMLALFDHRDQMEKLQANPDLMPTAVDEMLRWGSSIQNFRRTATRDTEVGGVPIAEGQKVVTYYLSGNYDEDHFDAPFEFRVDRTPNEHVTFGGGGVHFCLGSHLAKAEIGATIGSVIRRLPDIELAGEPERLRSDFINGIKHMPVRFTPRAARGAA
ncbi:MAG: cytochrome P450 [Actinobacteria bacterium]|nr:cytochrome P450 [Actinomycetota bacterium]